MSDTKEGPLYPTPEHHPHGGVSGFDHTQDLDSDIELEKHAIYEDPTGKKVTLNKEIPSNHKWFIGEYHLSPWGADISPYGGKSEDRIRVSMMGEKIEPTLRHGIASVYGIVTAVMDEKDRILIGQPGWWRLEDKSNSSKTKK